MTARAKTSFILRATIMLKLGVYALALAMLGGLLCGAFMLSALQFGPDQIGELSLAVFSLAPLVILLLIVISVFYILPMYRELRPVEDAELVSTEQALRVWARLHRFPRDAMIMSALMWIGWTAFIGWWLIHRGTINAQDAFLTLPACALLGVTNAIGFYFRSRAILRPVLLKIGGYLPPEFEPPHLFPIKRKLAMGFLYICLASTISLGIEILLWRQRGINDLALATARERMDLVARQVASGEEPDIAVTQIGGIIYRPFILAADGKPEVGQLEPNELALIRRSPRLLGFKEWRKNQWVVEAAVADWFSRVIPMPPFAPLRGRGIGRFDLIYLEPQPLRGGLRLGAVVQWNDESEGQSRHDYAPITLILIFFGATFLVSALWTYWVASDVVDPVRNLKEVINNGISGAAPGRTTLISDDEIGQLGAAFNRMSVVLSREMNEGRRLLEALRGAAGKINDIMKGIVDVASDQAAGATEQAASLHEVTTTSEEIAVTLRSIAEHSRTVEEVAGRSLSSCYDGQTHLNNVNTGMDTAQMRAHDVADKMLSFQEHANRIESILEFIREVSERINLISLNASIEASSAGESGSRFAIIASEMRKLAEKTMNGTKEIRTLFSDLQSSASSAIIATEEGEKQVSLARKLNDQASNSFQSIIHWAGETARAAQEISMSSSQQTTATDHLASALAEINDVASNFAEGAKSLENSVNDLEKIGEEMRILFNDSRNQGGMR